METSAPSLYERLGGAPAIEAVVDELYRGILGDAELAPFFARVNLRSQKGRMCAFVAMVTGGPNEYRGRDMKTAHARHAIEDRHFDLVAGHLIDALETVGADPAAADELVSAVAGLRGDVVNTRSEVVVTTG
jgi:hemoglobin